MRFTGRLWYTVRMSIEGAGKTREGKYCPRCHTMTFRDREVCDHCGHRFRTGLEGPDLNAPITNEADLHRTMQFTLPPLAPRGGPSPTAPLPDPVISDPLRPHRRLGITIAAVAVLLLVFLAGLAYVQHLKTTHRAAPSPAGVWETTLAGRFDAAARLQFDLRADGSGQFSWSANSAPPLSGQTALRWQVGADQKLVLTIAPPAAPDPFSSALITSFNSRPWPWHIDHPRHRLQIGTLEFVEK